MALSNDLLSQFAKVTKDDKQTKKETTVYGTVKYYNGKYYLQIDGSDLLTPTSTTADVKHGERVTAQIKDHSVIITGNMSSPAARTEDVQNILLDTEKIYKIEADNVIINERLEAVEGKISGLDVDYLTADEADIIYAKIETLNATNAEINKLKTNKLDVTSADLKYANINFSNINTASIGTLFSKAGIIENIVVNDTNITGELVGVTIKGDLIEGGTVAADKLVIKGNDGLYYKLNTDGIKVEAEQTEYNSLNGSIIAANSITASKIAVDDLVAFDATIGGFKITENSIYSGTKSSATNTTTGVFLGNDGQIAVGDSTNFLKYYKDQNGNYKLEISANSMILSSSNKNIETTLNEVSQTAQSGVTKANTAQSSIDNLKIGGRNYILNGSGTEKKGYFKNLTLDEDGCYSITFTSQKQYKSVSLKDGFLLGCRDYVVGSKVVYSYDIMYTVWDFPEGTNRQEFWMGQRYTTQSISGGSTNGIWRGVTQHTLPTVGVNGCELNKWYHVEKVLTIPEQADEGINTVASIQFYNSNADITATVSFKLRNVKLEYGTKATDWSPAPEDLESDVTELETRVSTVEVTSSDLTVRLDTMELNTSVIAGTVIGFNGDEIPEGYEQVEVDNVTNYMNFSTSGLVIGDMKAETLGNNVLIGNNNVDIRSGSATLASFRANTIYLGKNSETSIIDLCNGAATMRVKDNTDFRIYTDKRLVMSAYDSALIDCWRDSTHMTRIAIQSSDPDDTSRVGGVQFTIYQNKIQNTVQMLGNDIIHKVTDGTNETYTTMHESWFKVNTSGTIVLNSKSSSVIIGDSSSYSFGLRIGSTYSKAKGINCYWIDGNVHDLINQSSNGQTSYFGPADIDEVTTTNIRGRDVRLYCHSGGGVYLGSSGSTAITSDRNMKKDIIDIDTKYIDFFDRLRPITYKYNNGHRDHIGFIAQEVEEALEQVGLTTEQFAGLIIEQDVTLNPNYESTLTDEENKANEEHYDILYSLRYEEFISLLVKKVQNLQAQINELKGE